MSDQLFVKMVGTGKPVVFLHGFLEDHTIWNPIYPELVNSGYQCILIDLPAHGNTRFVGEQCSMRFMAETVFKYLANFEITNPYLIGHSLGGYVALELARLCPTKTILVHSNFWADSEQKRHDRDRVVEVVRKNKRLFLNEAIPNLFAPVNRNLCREQIDKLIMVADKLSAAEIVSVTLGLRNRRSSEEVMRNSHVVMIHGTDDPIIPNELLLESLAKHDLKNEVIRIESCGHMSFIEQPQALINALLTVLIQ